MAARTVPFDGTPPPVAAGDAVEIRNARGEWSRTVARSAPRYDFANAVGRQCHLTVAVEWSDGVVNWPAEDVRRVE